VGPFIALPQPLIGGFQTPVEPETVRAIAIIASPPASSGSAMMRGVPLNTGTDPRPGAKGLQSRPARGRPNS
jgi:hypothetical protein